MKVEARTRERTKCKYARVACTALRYLYTESRGYIRRIVFSENFFFVITLHFIFYYTYASLYMGK